MVALVFGLLVALPPAPKYVGVYRTMAIDASGRDREALKRPGEVRYLRLTSDHRWEWRDLMVGFGGTWSAKGRNLRLQILATPRGKPPRSQTLRLEADATGKRLRAIDPRLGGRRLVFVYDPTLLPRLSNEMQKRLKEARRKPKGL
jgi:hypothetical protein